MMLLLQLGSARPVGVVRHVASVAIEWIDLVDIQIDCLISHLQ